MRYIFALFGTLSLYGSTLGLEIPLIVEEPIGVPRRQAPVTSGVSLPRGQFLANQSFCLIEGDSEIPLQVTPLVVEKDGTLRWALLDFQLDIGSRENKRLTLKTEPGKARPKMVVQTTEDDNSILVNTGPLSFSVSKTKPYALFDTVLVRGKPVAAGGTVEFTDAKTNVRYTAGKPKNVYFEYRGPIRVTLRIDGTYQAASGIGLDENPCRLKYITRITAWAGRTDVRIQHILSNSNSEQVYHANVKNAGLVFHHTLGPDAEAIARAGGLSATLSEASSVWLHQGKVNRYYGSPIADAVKAGADNRTVWTEADSAGWMAVRKQDSSILVCDRDFVGDPPRRLAADKDRITIEYVSSNRRARGAFRQRTLVAIRPIAQSGGHMD